MSKQIVCIYGASGAVGAAAARELKKRGYALRLLIRSNMHPIHQILSEDCQRYAFDIEKEEEREAFCKGADLVLGCAGPSSQYSEQMFETAEKLGIPYVDPGGMHLLRRQKNASVKNCSVVGAGVFPGLSGWMLLHGIKQLGTPCNQAEVSVGGTYQFTKGAAIDFLEEEQDPEAGISMACIRDGQVVPAERQKPAYRPERVKNDHFLPYLSEEMIRLANRASIQNLDAYTMLDPALESFLYTKNQDAQMLMQIGAGQDQSQCSILADCQGDGRRFSQQFTAADPGLVTGTIAAITADYLLTERIHRTGVYVLGELLEEYDLLEACKKALDCTYEQREEGENKRKRAMEQKRILVCGTGFGKIYLNAISRMEGYCIGGILGTGSERTVELAKTFGVPCYTDIDQVKDQIDGACVIVPNAAGGGNGAAIAQKLLKAGIPTLLEHPAHEKELADCLRVSGKTPFLLNPFYRYTEPVMQFIKIASDMRRHSTIISASLNCAIHVLYDGLDMLGCALGNISSWKLGEATTRVDTELAGAGNQTVNARIGGVPTSITVNTNVDSMDPDHPLHLYHQIEITFSTGRLCLLNTHGPVLWMPFIRIPRNANQTLQFENREEELKIPSAMLIGEQEGPSVFQTFDEIWTGAVERAVEELFHQDAHQKRTSGQYQIFVSRLWSQVCQKVGYAHFVRYDETGNVMELYRKLQETEKEPFQKAQEIGWKKDCFSRESDGGNEKEEEMYGDASEYYDLAEMETWNDRKLILKKIGKVFAGCTMPVLDIGAGTGKVSLELAQQLPDLELIAIEPAKAMRTAFLAKLAQAEPAIRSRITLLPMRIQDCPLPERIGGVLCAGVIGHLDREERLALWNLLGRRMEKGAPMFLEILDQKLLEVNPGLTLSVSQLGQSRYETCVEARNRIDASTYEWTLAYRMFVQDTLVATERVKMKWYYQDISQLLAELEAYGFRGGKISETMLLVYKKEEYPTH